MSEKSLGQIGWEGFWKEEPDFLSRAKPWSEIVTAQNWENAAQAVRLAVIEECAGLVDQSAENADWGHSRETMLGMLFRKQARALRALK